MIPGENFFGFCTLTHKLNVFQANVRIEFNKAVDKKRFCSCKTTHSTDNMA